MWHCRETTAGSLGQEGTKERRGKQPHHTMGQTETRISHHCMAIDSRWPGLLISLPVMSQGTSEVRHQYQLPAQCRHLVHGDDDRGFSSRESADITAAAGHVQQKNLSSCALSTLRIILGQCVLMDLLHQMRLLHMLQCITLCNEAWPGLHVELSCVRANFP